ncbi:amino acid ABC transporter permease [Neobacillus cucumis]|uniref:amino acid ABC transporter permease n=1 Tax=Bacillaceae TaxID=186817 RepID=UPI0018E02FC2|nr:MULTISPECIES: amino acid ABC transporter permease [Bacillaceae]MBI0576813.1 amino acid ABC transporter permease [Neobacillus cucumis]MED1472509.1 amino acid ABC transporter permease [Bacillus salipaludis]WHY93810.1 amino acid ABC transporter permease [Neobacillus cucumis]
MRGIEMVWQDFPNLLVGAGKTLEIVCISLLFATIIGLIFGMFRISSNRILQSITRVYVSIIRGTPLYVQIIFVYFAIMPMIVPGGLSPMVVGAMTISINAGAYLAEVFRAGITSIDKGQEEASSALGFTKRQTFFYVILPQAVKRMTPAFMNQFSISLKDTSLLAVIGVVELTYSAQIGYAQNYEIFAYLFTIGLMYWVLYTSINWLTELVERKVSN